jgi:hypothetical protein
MVRNREEAVQAALNTHVNTPRMCQAVTRGWFAAPSVGDFDGDGAADAEDGWKTEPAHAKHTDRKPPRGTPVSYGGGSADNGHRAISLGPVGPNGSYMIRSTDADGVGRVGTVPLDFPERQWNMPYLGWSETISGIRIPLAPVPEPPKPVEPKNNNVTKARRLLRKARDWALEKGKKGRAKNIQEGLNELPKD